MPTYRVTGKYAHATATLRLEADTEAEARKQARRRWRKGTRIVRVLEES